MSDSEKDVKRFSRLLLLPLVDSKNPPTKVESYIGDGFNVVLHSKQGKELHLCFVPAKVVDEYFASTGIAAFLYFKPDKLEGEFHVWAQLIADGLVALDSLYDWGKFLDWAYRQPKIKQQQKKFPAVSDIIEPVSSGEELLVRITEICNASCKFCSAHGVLPDLVTSDQETEERLKAGRDARKDMVSFTGGEPTLKKELIEYLKLAKHLGYERLEVQSNGLLLADKKTVANLADAGMTAGFLSLHSDDEQIHNKMLGQPKAFEKVLQAAGHLLDSKIKVGFNCVISTININDFVGLPVFIADHFGVAETYLCFSFCSPQGKALSSLELMPRLEEIKAPLAEALKNAVKTRLSTRVAGICGVPMCLLPNQLEFFDEFHATSVPKSLTRKKLPTCTECSVNQKCSVFWNEYFEKYGEAEFIPLPVQSPGE